MDALPLVEVRGLVKTFPVQAGAFGESGERVHAVSGVDFAIAAGETLGLVGESGCGKTTVGRCLLRLIEPDAGEILYRPQPDGETLDVRSLTAAGLRRLRRDWQIVFQDPFSSLNPRLTVEGIVGEPLAIHGVAEGTARREAVARLLEEVGLSPSHLGRYPHEFSGGQRQRIGIARSLALSPRFIVCDEPVSALDVSIQAQILNLLRRLQEKRGIAYLFIAHNLHVVEHLSHRVAVMYLGEIVETAPAGELYREPRHPYTQALLAANPVPDPVRAKALRESRVLLEGQPPTPIDPPRGCRFHPRCPLAAQDATLLATCREVPPPRVEISPGHQVACHAVARTLSNAASMT